MMSVAAAPGVPSSSDWTSGLRLPLGVRPLRYDLALAPDLEAHTFQGHVRIQLQVERATNDIVMHSFELTYPNGDDGAPDVQLFAAAAGAAAAGAGAEEDQSPLQRALTVDLDDAKSQRVRVAFKEEVQPGEYVLALRFNGILNDQLAGFYRSAYVSARDGKDKFMAVTQFEATDCRRAIPCWDEPAIKAVFAVTLVVEPTQAAVSNMPVLRTETILSSPAEQKQDRACRGLVVPRGWIRYTYADSPIMSSYLLAFVVGEFDYISAFTSPVEGVDGSGRVELRIYTPVGQTKQGEFAMDVALKCMALYERFFQLSYPLPKLDLLAIPDFASGAMENWGAITYRDTMLLIDPDNSSALIKQRCAKTIAHEIAHMWFGNLVTMEWWSTLWLNEGFARYCESWAVDVIFPDWQVMDQFINEVYGLAQSMDSLESSHPVEVEVNTPEEINEIFDPISYNKGASLIRMLIETIGAASFQRGLQIYLREFAYKNTTSADLWQSFSKATAEAAAAAASAQDGSVGVAVDIQALMSEWVSAIGYPVLRVEEAETRAPTQRGCKCFAVSQAKFLQSGKGAPPPSVADLATADSGAVVAATSTGAAGTAWSVPLAIGSYSANSVKALAISHRILSTLSGHIELPSLAAEEAAAANGAVQPVYSFNHGATGFYRVLYSPSLLTSLSSLIRSGVLPALDRLSLLRDCFSLSACGLGYTAGHLLDLLVLFDAEDNFTVLQFLCIVLGGVAGLHQGQAYYPQLQKLVVRLLAPRWSKLGWGPAPGEGARTAKKEHHLTMLERSMLLSLLGAHGTPDVAGAIQQRAFAMLSDFIADPVGKAIQPDLRAPVYALAIKARGQAARDLLVQLYTSSASNEERVRVLSALGTTCGRPDTAESDAADTDRLLAWVFESGAVRTGDLIYVLSSVGQDSAASRRRCWAYMQRHWESLMAKFRGAMFVLGRILPSVLGEMSSAAEVEEFEQWFQTHPAVGAERSVKQSAETVRMKTERLAREVPVIAQWFSAHADQL